ncbi:hypothetical protein ACWET9_32270 [Streptomyces sp. NPDC004059]
MLRVEYETTNKLKPDSLVEIEETRGHLVFRLREGAVAEEFIPPLNAAIADFLSRGTWFQIWRGQVISCDSPDSPLQCQYEADPTVPLSSCVQIREDRGIVRLHVNPTVPAEFLVRVLNPAIEQFLAGGQWFQLWEGEIVTMDDSRGSAAA